MYSTQKVESLCCDWETKEGQAWTPNQLVYRGLCKQEYLMSLADDGFVDVIEEDVHHFYFSD